MCADYATTMVVDSSIIKAKRANVNKTHRLACTIDAYTLK